jgi:hypothetical protein
MIDHNGTDTKDRIDLCEFVVNKAMEKHPTDDLMQMTYAHHLVYEALVSLQATLEEFKVHSHLTYERKQ